MAGAAVIEIGHEAEVTKQQGLDLAGLTKMYDFTGKSVAITGGAGILGSEIASALRAAARRWRFST
jgi:TnpA family transposase